MHMHHEPRPDQVATDHSDHACVIVPRRASFDVSIVAAIYELHNPHPALDVGCEDIAIAIGE